MDLSVLYNVPSVKNLHSMDLKLSQLEHPVIISKLNKNKTVLHLIIHKQTAMKNVACLFILWSLSSEWVVSYNFGRDYER